MKKKETSANAPKATKATATNKVVKEQPVKVQEIEETEEVEETEEEVDNSNVRTIPRTKLPKFTERIPDHTLSIALLVKNNAEIKRFTALNILNYLLQKGIIKGEHRYVVFKFDKFAVKCNGLTREFSYAEPFFINALIAAFTCFAHSAQKVIDKFVYEEIEDAREINNTQQSEMIAETDK